jgi:cyclase
MTRSVCTAIALLSLTSVSFAQAPPDPPNSPNAIYKKRIGVYYPGSNNDAALSPDSPFFNIVKMADGVYNAIGVEGTFANCQIIINSDHVVVVDATLRPMWAKELIKQIKKLTPKPVRYVVFTHWHIDHVGGAQAFSDEYPSVQFIGHRMEMKDHILVGYQRKIEFLGNGSTRAIAAVKEELTSGKDHDGKPLDARMRADLEKQAAQEQVFLAENAQIRNILPTVVYDDTLILRDSVRDVEVRYLGIAHTRGDSFVFLPKEKMVMTGDSFGTGLPGGHDGYPIEWQKALQALYRLDWNTVIPAHGRPFTGKTQLVKAIDYLNDMNNAVISAVDRKLTLEQTQKEVTLVSHAKDFPAVPNFAAANGPIVARAWAVLTGQARSINGEPILPSLPD